MDVSVWQQRLRHLVDSYHLSGQEPALFNEQLARLAVSYSYPVLELATVEVLVQNWVRYPLPRGMVFLEQVRSRLQDWQIAAAVTTFLTPVQFEHITGLSPLGIASDGTFPTSFDEITSIATLQISTKCG